MPLLIEKGFFNLDHKEGLPLRNLLKDLDKRNQLYLLPQVQADQKEKCVLVFQCLYNLKNDPYKRRI